MISFRELEAQVRSFDPEVPLERATTPPSAWYTDARFWDLEMATVFRHNWVAVGLQRDVAEPGQILAGQLGKESYLVVRGQDGVVRGFHNVCRHHASCLIDESSCRREQIRCPYHGWTYGLDGSLLRAPRVGRIENFAREDFGLVPIPVRMIAGVVFLWLGDRQPDEVPDDWLEHEAALDRCATDELTWVCRETFVVPCNWKVYIDNYLDGGYHIAVLHEDLDEELDMETYQTRCLSRSAVQFAGGGRAAHQGQQAEYTWLYPNITFNRYGPVLDTNIVLPDGHDRCRVIFDFWFAETEGEEAQAFIAQSLATSRRIQDEDELACRLVQQGLASSAYDTGRYAPGIEAAEHLFHALLAADYRRALV